MKSLNALGIIAEYNPFHKGHAYHIARSRELSGADCVIVVMSGNFVQRGEPAVMDKYIRTRMALSNGADLVIELPVISATASAQYFARGSIGILKELKANYLSFGSEAGEITPFLTAANLLTKNSSEIDRTIHALVKEGISYPLARARAIEQIIHSRELTSFFDQPNNILGLEYLLEIEKQHAPMTPLTIKRTGNHYHDTKLSHTYSSASAIRNALAADNEAFWDTIPENTHDFICSYFDKYTPVLWDDFTDIVRFRLLSYADTDITHRKTSLSQTADLPDYLLNKLLSRVRDAGSVTQLIEAVKTKDLTYTRISRALLHLILNITESDYQKLKENPCPYIRVLGFNETGQAYLSSVKKEVSCPLIVKPANFKEPLAEDIYASDIYNLILSRKSGRRTISDYQHEIIKGLS